MCDKELQEYNAALDALETSVQRLRLASCSLNLESLYKAKSDIFEIKALANRAQGSLSRVHDAYTLHLENLIHQETRESENP